MDNDFCNAGGPKNKSFKNPTVKVKAVKAFSEGTADRVKVSHWTADELISINKQDIAGAVLTVSGDRITGQNKGRKFEWRIPLKALGEYGASSKVFDDGLMFALQLQYRPAWVPHNGLLRSLEIKHTAADSR